MAQLPPQSRGTDDARGRDDRPRSWWLSPVGLVTFGFLGVGGFFLITEHTAHVFGALPWLLLAAIMAAVISRAGAQRLRDRRRSHDP